MDASAPTLCYGRPSAPRLGELSRCHPMGTMGSHIQQTGPSEPGGHHLDGHCEWTGRIEGPG